MKNWNSIAPCQDCGTAIDRHSILHKYCQSCSEARAQIRKNNWNQKYRTQNRAEVNEKAKALHKEMSGVLRDAGKERSTGISHGDCFNRPQLAWYAQISVPFSYSISKNHIYGMNGWHVFKRQEGRKHEANLIVQIRNALLCQPNKIRQDKVWISIHVEKPNHRGDAVNVVDMVCDAIKKAINLDDRWFCLGQVNWSINKNDPQLFIQIGQEDGVATQVCSHCGALKPFDAFSKHKGNKNGMSRTCNECSSAARRLKRERRMASTCT